MGSVQQYDFIVVGAGPAGCSLATRLARSSQHNILLLEAGGSNADPSTRVLADRYSTFMTQPHMNWGYKSAPQTAFDGREVDYSRGKGLGGSSAINFAYYTIGPKEDYDEWARIVGNDSYAWKAARKRINRMESYDRVRKPEYKKYNEPLEENHGHDGPLPVSLPETWERSLTDAMDAYGDYGLKLNKDTNSGDPIGVGIIPSIATKGIRISASGAYLKDVPDNLTILPDAQVERIMVEGKRAIGVKLVGGAQYMATKEVIVTAGALDSPKLLLLSGIGPKEELEKHNIQQVHELPGVGRNLQDHWFIPLTMQQHDGTNDRAALYGDPKAMEAARAQFAKDGSGPLSSFYGTMLMAWLKDQDILKSPEYEALPKNAQKHLQAPTVPTYEITSHTPTLSPDEDPNLSYHTMLAIGMSIQSHGTVTLSSANPSDAPICDPKLFSNPFDKANCIAAVRTILKLWKSPSLAKTIKAPFMVPASDSDEDIWNYCKMTGGTVWHMSCTVKMGAKEDEMACLDDRFRVRGMEGLRVVDLSALPFVFNCHTVAVAYFMGETAADLMGEEYGFEVKNDSADTPAPRL